MLVTHLSAVAPSVALLMMVALLPMMLLVVLILEFMVHIHLHIALVSPSSIHHYVLPWLVVLIIHTIGMRRRLGNRGA